MESKPEDFVTRYRHDHQSSTPCAAQGMRVVSHVQCTFPCACLRLPLLLLLLLLLCVLLFGGLQIAASQDSYREHIIEVGHGAGGC